MVSFCKEIYNRVKNMGLYVSYQAVHKTIRELLDDGIILKEYKAHSINKDWIDGVKNFADNLSKVYEDKTTMTIGKAFGQGYRSVTIFAETSKQQK